MRKYGILFGIALILLTLIGIIASALGWWVTAITALFIVILLSAALVVSYGAYLARLVQTNSRKSMTKLQDLNIQLATLRQNLDASSSVHSEEDTRFLTEQVEALENALGSQVEQALRASRMDVEAAKNYILAEINRPSTASN